MLYYRQKKPENMAVRTEEDKGGFFMNLKTVRILLFTLLALTLASFLIGGRLGRSDGESCPHCGKSLLAPRGHQAG